MSPTSSEAVIRSIEAETWAIERRSLQSFLAAAELAPIMERVRAAQRSSMDGRRVPSQIGVVPIVGPIWNRPSVWSFIFGGSSTMEIGAAIRRLVADPDVGRIILDVDSPGGVVDGMTELAAIIRTARARKPIIAVANTMAASAAYWIASQASELWVTPSGTVGSIGVFRAHDDVSKAMDRLGVKRTLVSAGKYKTEGADSEPLSSGARKHIQDEVDAYYRMFTTDVALGRGAAPSTVRGEAYGEGRMILAVDAVKQGMADRIGTLEGAVTAAVTAQNVSRAALTRYRARVAARGRA